MDSVNGFPPQEMAKLVTRAGLAKARLGWIEYMVKSFMGGVFIALGGLTDLTIVSGCPGLRESNPALATMIGGFMFPMGFVLVIITNMELCTSNMFVMPFTQLQRRTNTWDLVKNWIISYIGNMAGCLFVAGFMAWWSNVLDTDAQTAYAVKQAEDRVNVQWSVNFLRGVGCNFFVALAFFMTLGSVEFVSKVYTIWIPIWSFVILGYQHSIANYFMVPLGMFYGTNFGVGKFIYQSIIPVTLGNIVGGALMGSLVFWFLYGRNDGLDVSTGQPVNVEKDLRQQRMESDSTIGTAEASTGDVYRGGYDRNGMVNTA